MRLPCLSAGPLPSYWQGAEDDDNLPKLMRKEATKHGLGLS